MKEQKIMRNNSIIVYHITNSTIPLIGFFEHDLVHSKQERNWRETLAHFYEKEKGVRTIHNGLTTSLSGQENMASPRQG